MALEDGLGTTGAPAALSWTVWPAAKRPWLSVLVALFCLALAGGAAWSFGSQWYALITLVVLAVALLHYGFIGFEGFLRLLAGPGGKK